MGEMIGHGVGVGPLGTHAPKETTIANRKIDGRQRFLFIVDTLLGTGA
jgi:hypothetical protein